MQIWRRFIGSKNLRSGKLNSLRTTASDVELR
jgi:hypothetical protein